jgi:hypothetical protein
MALPLLALGMLGFAAAADGSKPSSSVESISPSERLRRIRQRHFLFYFVGVDVEFNEGFDYDRKEGLGIFQKSGDAIAVIPHSFLYWLNQQFRVLGQLDPRFDRCEFSYGGQDDPLPVELYFTQSIPVGPLRDYLMNLGDFENPATPKDIECRHAILDYLLYGTDEDFEFVQDLLIRNYGMDWMIHKNPTFGPMDLQRVKTELKAEPPVHILPTSIPDYYLNPRIGLSKWKSCDLSWMEVEDTFELNCSLLSKTEWDSLEGYLAWLKAKGGFSSVPRLG